MAKVIDFKSAARRLHRTPPVNDGLPPLPKPIPASEFDFDEEHLNLLGILADIEHCSNPTQVKHVLGHAIDHVMTWPDSG